MRRVNDRNQAINSMMKVAKRIAITVLCCVPVMIVFGYLTRNVIKSNALQIVCFILIMGTVVLIEELAVRAKEKRQKEEIETKRDVFK